jgi:protein-disulfide isomerase
VSSALEVIDPVDHARGAAGGHVLVEYGDYECPYSARAYRSIRGLLDEVRFQFVYRHFPLTSIHPHALGAAVAAEAASLQDRFWPMHDWLFSHRRTLEDEHLREAARELGIDVEGFDEDRASTPVLQRVQRDVLSGEASGEVRGTPTIFIDGAVYRDSYEPDTLRGALSS